ncbi:hypothetical protein ACIF80_36105 [Streptomyces sp. NPDC085927]|uniref:hypothetical protein n=1 Tax=Streptomyces sp. NPDC085927 TaxID=3365738 RepID=UPI0037CD4FDB
MPHLTSIETAGRIEELYGAALADLEAHTQGQPPGMLSALLGMHQDLAFAERSITFHRDRLAQLVHPERQFGTHEVSHIFDCVRRLAEAVAVRETQSATTQAVLQSLGRAVAPKPSTDSATAALPVPPVPTASTVATR